MSAAVVSDRTSSPGLWATVAAAVRRPGLIVRAAIALVALQILDDSFLRPQPGTSPGDHLGSSGRGTRGSVQRTSPRVSTAIRLWPRTAATNSPWGDQVASR